MNEIEKLKAEHARYRKALETLDERGLPHAERHRIIDCALNPPPPPPVTLEDLKAALNRYNENHAIGGLYSIHFFRDESGSIRDCHERRVFSFYTLREAVDFLNQ